jgi:hypothetical protein
VTGGFSWERNAELWLGKINVRPAKPAGTSPFSPEDHKLEQKSGMCRMDTAKRTGANPTIARARTPCRLVMPACLPWFSC